MNGTHIGTAINGSSVNGYAGRGGTVQAQISHRPNEGFTPLTGLDVTLLVGGAVLMIVLGLLVAKVWRP